MFNRIRWCMEIGIRCRRSDCYCPKWLFHKRKWMFVQRKWAQTSHRCDTFSQPFDCIIIKSFGLVGASVVIFFIWCFFSANSKDERPRHADSDENQFIYLHKSRARHLSFFIWESGCLVGFSKTFNNHRIYNSLVDWHNTASEKRMR